MKFFGTLKEAAAGWVKILRGAAGWEEHFRLSAAGLVTALALFYFFAFLAVVLASMQVGVPTLQGFLDIMAVQTFWLVALVIGVYGTRFAVRSDAGVLRLFVPGIYGLIGYLILGSLISLIFGPLLPLLWLGLVFLFFRLGRVAGNWTNGVSLAFAILTVVLLVGVPISLYMLISPTLPAA